MSTDSRDRSRSHDLPARNARYARALAWIAFALLLVSIGFSGLMFVLGFGLFMGAAAAALVALLSSIAAMAFHHYCLSPRPEGPPYVLLASVVLCVAYGYLLFTWMSFAGMH